MTQVYTLAMVSYGIRIVPLIKFLKLNYPEVTQTWCAEDAGALVTFDHLEKIK